MERELPHDQQAEQALLGAMLIDKDACSEVINIAIPDDFFYDSHKVIFAAMKALQEERQPVDVTTLTTYLMDKKELDRIGGVNYLLTLSQSVPTTAHTQYYLKILNDKALLRRLIKESTDIITKSYDDIGNMNDFINDVEVEIQDGIMEIKLIGVDGSEIGKEKLSKGEQQLYATAILKSLVVESGISFPVLGCLFFSSNDM